MAPRWGRYSALAPVAPVSTLCLKPTAGAGWCRARYWFSWSRNWDATELLTVVFMNDGRLLLGRFMPSMSSSES